MYWKLSLVLLFAAIILSVHGGLQLFLSVLGLITVFVLAVNDILKDM